MKMRQGEETGFLEDKSGRYSPLEMSGEEFRRLGGALVERIAAFLDELPGLPVTPGESPETVRSALSAATDLPESGRPPDQILGEAGELLFRHSLFNSHPRFWGYVTAGPAPLGVLAEMLAAAVNPNVGAWKIAPAATEIELQVVRWIAQLIGYPTVGGGVLVSGGNLANFVGFLAGLRAKCPWDARRVGMRGEDRPELRVYASTETHTWLHKAADLFGLGLDAVAWIPVDREQRLRTDDLVVAIQADRDAGRFPLMVVGNAGTVGCGAVDPLAKIAEICRESGLWFHVDGAYGGMAAAVPGADPELGGLVAADSVAVDPHKWLYAPLEAGCVLVRDPAVLRAAFSHQPSYYHFGQEAVNFYEYGLQNSRGFRALKIWMQLQQAGRSGYVRMIGDDIRLAHEFHRLARQCDDIEVLTCSLSISTFRYCPADLRGQEGANRDYLDRLNQDLLSRIESGGEVFVSNAVVNGVFALRICIVNFRSTLADLRHLLSVVRKLGREVDQSFR